MSNSNDSREMGVRSSCDTALVRSRWLLISALMRSDIWLNVSPNPRMLENRDSRTRACKSPCPMCCAAVFSASRSRQIGSAHSSMKPHSSKPNAE